MIIILITLFVLSDSKYITFKTSCENFDEYKENFPAGTLILYKPITIFDDGLYKCNKKITGNTALVDHSDYDKIINSHSVELAKKNYFADEYHDAKEKIKQCDKGCDTYSTSELVLIGFALAIALGIIVFLNYGFILLVIYLIHKIRRPE